MNVLGFVTAATESACRDAVARVPGHFHVVTDLGEAVSRLAGAHPPSALIIDAARLDGRTTAVLQSLRRRRLLVPIRLFLPDADPGIIARAWDLPRDHITPVFSLADLVEDLRGAQADRLSQRIGIELMRRCRPSGPAEALVALLMENAAASTWTVNDVTLAINVPRSRLYDSLRIQSLPTVEQFQFLYRLLPAAVLIQDGGGTEDAAFRAQLADAAALRRALRTRLKVSVTGLRARHGWDWIVREWLVAHAHVRRRSPLAVGSTPGAPGAT